jgi:hypothetical protein
MFTQSQAAQVKQLVIRDRGQFVTEDQLQAMYDLDHAQYTEIVNEGLFEGTYSEYFGNILEDYLADFSFLDCVVDEVLAA